MIVNENVQARHDAIAGGSVVFSPDGSRMAYAARADGKWFFVIDGKAGNQYDRLGAQFAFSPDGERLAYWASEGAGSFVFVDGERHGPYDGIYDGPVFSPDGRNVAYAARRGRDWSVFLNGKAGITHSGLVTGARIVFDSADRFHYLVGRRWGDSALIHLVEERLAREAGPRACALFSGRLISTCPGLPAVEELIQK